MARVAGHKLSLSSQGKRKTATGGCRCGWSHTGASAAHVREAYAEHLEITRERRNRILTEYEERLLRYPPTERTWRCNRKRERERCDGINSGKMAKCLWCGQEKTGVARLIWPEYMAACEKADIVPGDPYPPRPNV